MDIFKLYNENILISLTQKSHSRNKHNSTLYILDAEAENDQLSSEFTINKKSQTNELLVINSLVDIKEKNRTTLKNSIVRWL